MIALRRTLIAVLVLLLAHELLARGLDRLDLIERLLSPGLDALIALPLALLLYAIRLALLFVAPAVVALVALRDRLDPPNPRHRSAPAGRCAISSPERRPRG